MKSKEELQWEFLEQCVKDYKIFIDTSSLLEPSVENFLQKIYPFLERENKSIIVPLSVCLELKKLAEDPAYCRRKSPNNPDLNKAALRAFKTIMIMRDDKRIEVHGDPDDGDFADNVFLHVFTKKRMQYDMLLITQDRGLASEVLNLGKDNRAVHGVKKILVQRINKQGFLQKIFDVKEIKTALNGEPVETSSMDIPINERFAFAKDVVQIEGQMPITHIPSTGETVTAVRNGKKK